MNLNDNPTLELFRDLLRQHDDRAGHHVLWVRKDGEVMLTCLPKGDYRKVPPYEHPELRLRYDLFPAGLGYVGTQSDDGWFKGELYKDMLEQWGHVKDTPGVTHIDLDTVAPEGRVVDAEERAQIQQHREEIVRRKQASRCHSTSNP